MFFSKTTTALQKYIYIYITIKSSNTLNIILRINTFNKYKLNLLLFNLKKLNFYKIIKNVSIYLIMYDLCIVITQVLLYNV